MKNDTYLFSMYNIHNRNVPYRKRDIIKTNTNKPEKKIDEYFEKLIKHKHNIIEFTKWTLEYPVRPDTSFKNTGERHMNETFLKFTLACIEHFDKKEELLIEESDDDSLMFDPFTKMKKMESIDISFTILNTMKKEKYPDK
jgi:hypothetical protein